jgi:hypothetical protein
MDQAENNEQQANDTQKTGRNRLQVHRHCPTPDHSTVSSTD